MDFLKYVGRGFGPAWRGILFRQSYPNLEEVIAKSLRWFPQIAPGAKYNGSKYCWVFPTGEMLYFRHASHERDYANYHGHEYPWVAFEELTNWPNDKLYIDMMSVCRSSFPGMPRHFRATTNPFGVGHHWVKSRFIDPAPRGRWSCSANGQYRVAIHVDRIENTNLLENDPDYVQRLEAQDGPKREAWLLGNWNIVAGGMFGDLWREALHVVEPFEIPPTWHIDRSFDWGSSRPYSVGWWAQSDGTDMQLRDGTPLHTRPGDLFRVAELYGWTGKEDEGTQELATEVAQKVRAVDAKLGRPVFPGPADTAIYSVDDGHCIADRMASEGVYWTPAHKNAGSRQNGWELLRERLKNVLKPDGPRLFVFSQCRQFIRTVPSLPRDEVDMDDVDSRAEDHVGDETRYRLLSKEHAAVARQI
jgi:hypothetical protein